MFITFEGVEGSGKSSALASLVQTLEQANYSFITTREPGGSKLGQELRRILLDPQTGDISSQAELFLYLADRAEHVSSVIRPALEAGKVVLCDRYVDSTLAYQGFGRGLNIATLQHLNQQATNGLEPDLTFLFDVDPELGLTRARTRNTAQNNENEGRFEAEVLEFHHAVRNGFLELAKAKPELKPERWHIIDASLSQELVFQQICTKLRALAFKI